jgi:hypothetical protein
LLLDVARSNNHYSDDSPEITNLTALNNLLEIRKIRYHEEMKSIVVELGNTVELLSKKIGRKPAYKWKVFVHPDSRLEMINRVQFILHPTFTDRVVSIHKAPFECERIGWGTFPVKVTMFLNPGYTVRKIDSSDTLEGTGVFSATVEWVVDLKFADGGSSMTCKLQVLQK